MENKLKMIENDLVAVYITSTGEKVVYGSELHQVLEVKSKFADWIKNHLNDCEATENEEFQSFSKILEKGGRPQTEYIIKLDTAKEMAMLERNEKGKQVRRYFIQVERKYKQDCREFGVSIYAAIKRCQTETAKKIIEEYKLPLALEEEIRNTNSQLEINL